MATEINGCRINEDLVSKLLGIKYLNFENRHHFDRGFNLWYFQLKSGKLNKINPVFVNAKNNVQLCKN